MIIFKDINCYYDGILTVKNINLTIKHGEMISIVGPSGCGKTTLLRTLCGLHEHFDGQVKIEGKDVSRMPAHKRSAIMVFQEYLLYPHLSVLDNVGFGLKMHGIKKKERIKRIKPLLDKMGLGPLADRYPNELSGGQKQRVALARALAVQPEVLLLDEPFSSLDEQLRDDMRQFVCELQKELDITTVFVTHDIEEALLSSDRVVVMNDGEIQQIATPRALYHQPKNYIVGKMLGGRSFIRGYCQEGLFHWLNKATPCASIGLGQVSDTQESYLMLPSEALSLADDLTGDLVGVVKQLAFGGMRYELTLEVAGQKIALMLAATEKIEVGDHISLNIDWSKTSLLE